MPVTCIHIFKHTPIAVPQSCQIVSPNVPQGHVSDLSVTNEGSTYSALIEWDITSQRQTFCANGYGYSVHVYNTSSTLTRNSCNIINSTMVNDSQLKLNLQCETCVIQILVICNNSTTHFGECNFVSPGSYSAKSVRRK